MCCAYSRSMIHQVVDDSLGACIFRHRQQLYVSRLAPPHRLFQARVHALRRLKISPRLVPYTAVRMRLMPGRAVSSLYIVILCIADFLSMDYEACKEVGATLFS